MTASSQRVVLITGGAKGIGRAICQAFDKAKDKVYFVDLDEGAGRELEATMKGSVFLHCDVGNQESIRHAVEQVGKEETQIEILVNNAGISLNQDFLSVDAISAFEKVINVNLRGTFLFSHYTSKYMKNGSIINIASTRALQSEANTEGYSASKGGIVALTHAMAMSLAPRHIRVNAISPGWIDVQHYQSSVASNKPASHANPYQITQKDQEQHPVGRVGIPRDIANMVLFLSDN